MVGPLWTVTARYCQFFPPSLHLVFWQREVTREPWLRLERQCFWPVISVWLPQAHWDALMHKHLDGNSHDCMLMCPQMHTDSDISKCMHGREVGQPTCKHLHILNITERAQMCTYTYTQLCVNRQNPWGSLWGLDVRNHHVFCFCAPQRASF